MAYRPPNYRPLPPRVIRPAAVAAPAKPARRAATPKQCRLITAGYILTLSAFVLTLLVIVPAFAEWGPLPDRLFDFWVVAWCFAHSAFPGITVILCLIAAIKGHPVPAAVCILITLGIMSADLSMLTRLVRSLGHDFDFTDYVPYNISL